LADQRAKISRVSDKPIDLLDVYSRLRRAQGVQNWWPGTTSFEVVVGCILTQNTNWVNVRKAIAALSREGLMCPDLILDTNIDVLTELTRPAGFCTQKPFRLKTISHWWKSYFGNNSMPLTGVIESRWGEVAGLIRIPSPPLIERDIEDLRLELDALSGVGPETADAIILYAVGLPSFVVDAYTRRVFSRLGIVSENVGYEELRSLFQPSLPKDVALFNDFHAQITTLAKTHCLKTPICKGCPLSSICEHSITLLRDS